MLIIYVVLAFIFVTGLCIGSFLNVVILRALSNESIVFPASKCPKCQNPLKWWHNIPVLSYILLRGKCAYCKEHISLQYPIIELLTGIVFVLVFLKYGFRVDTLFILILSSLLIVLAGTDIKEKVVFDVHAYTLIGVSFLYAIFIVGMGFYMIHHPIPGYVVSNMTFWHNPLTNAVIGAIVGALIMELLARSGYLFADTRAFGEGDTLIAAGLGAMFGWYSLLFVLLTSVVIQVILFLPLFLKGLWDNKDFRTLILFLIFVIYAISMCIMQYKGLLDTRWSFLLAALILCVLGISSTLLILRGLRERPESRTYLPFGPAMVAAALIFLLLG